MEFPINFAVIYLIILFSLIYSDEIIRWFKIISLFKKVGKDIRRCKKCETIQVKYFKRTWVSLRKVECECYKYHTNLDENTRNNKKNTKNKVT